MGVTVRDERQRGWWWDFNDVFEHGLSAYALVVRFFLARCANGSGQSFPSINTIAQKCSISRSTVVRALKELEDNGWIRRDSRKKENSKEKDTTVYTLLVVEEGSVSQTLGSITGNLGSVSQNRGVVSDRTDVGSDRAREQDLYNNTNLNNNIYSPEFELFWSIYPRKIEKKKTFKLWEHHIKTYKPEQLIQCAKNYADYCKVMGTEESYIKHPSTFLSKRDEPFKDYIKPYEPSQQRKEQIQHVPRPGRAAPSVQETEEFLRKYGFDGGDG